MKALYKQDWTENCFLEAPFLVSASNRGQCRRCQIFYF